MRVLVFDTETTGLSRENGYIQPAIMQIVIFNENGESIFSQYVILCVGAHY